MLRGRPVEPFEDAAPIEQLNLSVRAYNGLRRANVRTVGQLRAMPNEELLQIRNFGQKCAAEVRERLGEYPAPDDADAGDEEGLAGSREPRRPLPGGSAAGAMALPEFDEGAA